MVATELYAHDESPLPVDWAVEHVNVVNEPGMSAVAKQLHEVLVKCGPRPDLCPPSLLKGLVG